MRSVPRRGALAASVALLTMTAGCGFLADLADPQDAPVQSAPTSTGVAPPTPDPDAPRVLVDTHLLRLDGRDAGHLEVTVGPLHTGSVPPVGGFAQTCAVDWRSLQWVDLEFRYTETDPVGVPKQGLAAHVGITPTDTTPRDIARAGVLVQSRVDDCTDAGGPPETDTFWNAMGSRTSGYVFLDGAVTGTTPSGRPEVFPTYELRVSDLRYMPDPDEEWSLVADAPAVGAACPDDPAAICVPLG